MSADERMGFWSGLGRLYDETLAIKESIADLRKVAEAHQHVVERHSQIVEAHEKRVDRLDVLVEWLAEKERGRELRP